MASNMMEYAKSQYAAMTAEQLKRTGADAANGLMMASMQLAMTSGNMENAVALTLKIMISSLKLGFNTRYLSQKQKQFLQNALPKSLIDSTIQSIADSAAESITQEDYDAVNVYNVLLQKGVPASRTVGDSSFKLLMSAAYIDGSLSNVIAEKIDAIFGMVLFGIFADSGLESVPAPAAPRPRVTGLEARVLDYMLKQNTMLPLNDIAKAFPGETKTSIKKALDGLCEKELVNWYSNVILEPYGVEVDRGDVDIVLSDYKSSRSSKSTAAQKQETPEEKKKREQAEAERKRKEEEEKKKREEQEKKKRRAEAKAAEEAAQNNAKKVIDAIRGKLQEAQGSSLSQQLSEMKARTAEIENICHSYDDVQSNISELQKKLTDSREKESALRTERKALGLFDGKKKKAIDADLNDLEDIITQTQSELDGFTQQLSGFRSKAQAQQELSRMQESVSALKKRIAERISLKQAMDLLADHRVEELVMAEDPLLITYGDFFSAKEKIRFGHFQQGENGEILPISWHVLERDGNRLLLLSQKGLAYQEIAPYSMLKLTWYASTIRTWLNNTFLSSAFSEAERDLITETKIPSAGKSFVFLLSQDEATKYRNNYYSMCYPSPKLEKEYFMLRDHCYGRTDWWLRSQETDLKNCFHYTDESHKIYWSGMDTQKLIRPALWIDLSITPNVPVNTQKMNV